MAEPRDIPYSQFNFIVDMQEFQAGFQEVSGLNNEITVAEYRTGDDQDNGAMKITGRYKAGDVTFKRGVIGKLELYKWMKDVRDGKQDAMKTITVQLKSEDRETVAMTWTLINARPIKYNGPSLNGKGTEVAIEEIVMACERIDWE